MASYYRQVADEVQVFELCYANNLPLLIKGPTGCGKSQLVAHMAEKLGRPLVKVACNEDTTASDLLGRYLIKGMETVWQDGPVTRAVKEGALLYLDEIAEAREDVIVALHPLTDHRRELYLDRLNETLQAPKEFMCVASFNPGYQRGLKELKPSTRQRFVTVLLNYPSAAIEAEILTELTQISADAVKRLVQLAGKVRGQPQLGLRETVSTRLLVHTSRLIQAGLHPRQAARVGIAEALTDETKTVDALQDLINLHF